MSQISVAELLSDSPVDPAAHLDAQRVARYVEIFDELPPVVVFRIGERLILADGYHRLAAARLRGEDRIEAEIREGDRADVLRFVTRLGAAQSGLPEEQVRRRVERRGGRPGGASSPEE